MDVIEWMMPSLMRVLMSKECVQFDPTGPGDELLAKRETSAITHLIWKQNPGFMILYNWIKDGLMQKVGYLHYWWEEGKKTEFERFTGLTDDQLVMTLEDLGQDHEVKVMASSQDDNGLWDIKLRKTKKYRGCPKMAVYPPDEVIVDKDCRGNIKEAKFVGHIRRNVTRSELVDMGYSKKRVGELSSYTYRESSEERRARDTVNETDEGDDEGGAQWASKELTLMGCWTYLDADDDGIAELRYLLLAGNDILEDEEIPEINWESWTPTPVPHRHVGLSVYDRMEELLRMNTALWRGILDNTYFTMNQRIAFDSTVVDTKMLGVNRPGGHVAVKGSPLAAMMPIPVNPMQGQILPVIDLVRQARDKRTGTGDMAAGLDADTLAKATKGAYIDAKTSSSQLTEAIATIFAHTGLASLYTSLHGMLRRNQDWAAHFKQGKEWVEVDPSQWLERDQLTVSVGSTTKEEVRQNLGVMAGAQTQLGTAFPGMIRPQNAFALFTEMQNQLGFEGKPFATDPDSTEYAQATAEKPPPPDPYLEAEKMKAAQRAQEAQTNAELKAKQMGVDFGIKVAELELQYATDLAQPGIGAELTNGSGGGAPRAARPEPAQRPPAG